MKKNMQSRHVISVSDFDLEFLGTIFKQANHLKLIYPERFGKRESEWNFFAQTLRNYVFMVLFYEPSTRTRMSFETAIKLLGGTSVHTENAREFSSVTKGETLEDTIRVAAGYGDGIILRHHESGSAKCAAEVSSVPIFNAGDGDGEHPTQALLDLFTIRENFSKEKNLVLVGDLKKGRTVQSLALLAAKLKDTNLSFADCISFVAPEELQASKELVDKVMQSGIKIHKYNTLTEQVASRADIIYMTRAQLERHEGKIKTGDSYALTPELVSLMKQSAIILHPLPRNAELPETIDMLPQAQYFEQAQNGMFIRMALLLWAYKKTHYPS